MKGLRMFWVVAFMGIAAAIGCLVQGAVDSRAAYQEMISNG